MKDVDTKEFGRSFLPSTSTLFYNLYIMLTKLLRFLMMVCTPFALCCAVITLVIGAWFPRFEYAKPGFPEDLYGFTQEDRLDLALVAVNYLAGPESAAESIYLLEEQTMPNSEDPLYTQGEIDHMVDVKVRTDQVRIGAWLLGISLAVGSAVMLVSSKLELYKTWRSMGRFTVLFLLGIGAYVVLRWEKFFVQFHELLFEDGTWTFSTQSSLIRLFPETLWFDCGLAIVGGTFLGGLILWIIGRFLTKRAEAKLV